MLSPFWENVGIATAVAFGCLLMILAFAARLKGMAMELAAFARRTPVRTAIAGLALGVFVSYAGTKPPVPTTAYTVRFELPLAFESIESMQCEPGRVYKLPSLAGYRWKSSGTSSGDDRLYDGGLLIFDLAMPGETVTLTAIGEW